jgi:hypothetical protein
MVSSLKVAVPSNLPPLCHLLTNRLTGVTELDLSSFGSQKPSRRRFSNVAFLPGLKSLNLAGNAMDRDWIGHTTTALRLFLTGLTSISQHGQNQRVTDRQLAVVGPFLPSLEHLDLEVCSEIGIMPEDARGFLGCTIHPCTWSIVRP